MPVEAGHASCRILNRSLPVSKADALFEPLPVLMLLKWSYDKDDGAPVLSLLVRCALSSSFFHLASLLSAWPVRLRTSARACATALSGPSWCSCSRRCRAASRAAVADGRARLCARSANRYIARASSVGSLNLLNSIEARSSQAHAKHECSGMLHDSTGVQDNW